MPSVSEIITTYLLNDLDQPLPMGREEFYHSQVALFHAGQKPNRAVEIVQILLFTPEGDLILQKRSQKKDHNQGLIDKTIGGHITFGNSPWFTATSETLQELHVPSFVLPSDEDFLKSYRLLHNFLAHSALVQYIDSKTLPLPKLIKTDFVPVLNKYHFYLGIYGGAIKPVEKEASGIILYTFDHLRQELRERPRMYTEDLKFFLEKYQKQITEFLKSLTQT